MPSLEQLAASAQAGDVASFRELAERVREPLCAFLRTRLPHPDDADDVAQEALLRAFQNLHRYDAERSFVTWLYTIGKRLAINYAAADRRRGAAAQRAQQQGPAVHTEDQRDGALWRTARAVLSEHQYAALWLRYVRGDSVAEVAHALGRTAVSTKVLLYRARKRLLLEVEK